MPKTGTDRRDYSENVGYFTAKPPQFRSPKKFGDYGWKQSLGWA